jgi:predicted RNA methylase
MNHRSGTKNPARLLAAFALLAKLAACTALVFVLLSAISTADDDVQQEAIAQPQLHVLRVSKPILPTVVSAALVVASSYRFEAIHRFSHKIHEPELLAPLSESLCPPLGRSPPRIFPV